MNSDGHSHQQDIVRQFAKPTRRSTLHGVNGASMRSVSKMSYSQTSPPSSWRAIKGSSSRRRRPQEGLNTYRHKHPPKIHVWGGISKLGAIHLVMFGGIMNATRYGDILSASLVRFIWKTYPDGHRLYQDNDPKHTSKYIQSFFLQNDITW